MYSMKGVLNSQFKTAFIATLQKTYRDERFIARFYWELADHEQENNRCTLLTWLANLAEHKKAYCALLLHRLGAVIPVDNQSAGNKHPYRLDTQKGNTPVVRQLERWERSDFSKLIALCNAQRRWV
jgi:hypothetical protein